VLRSGRTGGPGGAAAPGGARAASAASPTLTVTVYKVSIATLYGPGFYGTLTACGLKLTKRTLGTANRTLKCGTPVAIYYHGRTLVVPVIDRGPYANGADWDLTMATGKLLGVDGTAKIGAAAVAK
jgi:rare lipoprotein A (peptidoglycan hydrolase)